MFDISDESRSGCYRVTVRVEFLRLRVHDEISVESDISRTLIQESDLQVYAKSTQYSFSIVFGIQSNHQKTPLFIDRQTIQVDYSIEQRHEERALEISSLS